MRRTIVHIVCLILFAPFATGQTTITLEAEDATLNGTLVATTRPAFSGAGYVTGFDGRSDAALLRFNAAGGVYDLRLRYAANAAKEFQLVLNGLSRSGRFDPSGGVFADAAVGKVELLEGANTLEIRRGWGYFDIDRIELVPSKIGEIVRPPVTLVTPDPSASATALLRKLIESYGEKTLSGVYSIGDARFVREATGKTPAVLGGDLMDYSPSRVEKGSKPGRTVEDLIARAKEGYDLTISWHWNAPRALIDAMIKEENGREIDARWYKGFYTNATTFDVAAALSDPAGEDYRLLVRDIDAIAIELKKLADADVPVLWRPLHEADGKWFWWGAKGPSAFKQLWSLMYARLTQHHKLGNLIWVYTGTGDFDWYPPENEFDVVGVDAYPSDPHDPLGGLWETILSRYSGKKLVALSEFGGVPDVDAMHRLGVRFAYFNSWTGDKGPRSTPRDDLARIYSSPRVANKEP